MANEITALERRNDTLHLVFFYPIPLAKRKGVATPSDGLPPIAFAVFSDAEKLALDAGEAFFTVDTIEAPEGMTAPQLAITARARYKLRRADLASRYGHRMEKGDIR